jgi:zinc protease
LQERMFQPLFTTEAFSRLQKQTLESFKLRKSQPTSIADDIGSELSYGQGHVLGIPSVGTEFSVKNLSVADVESYYKNYMTSRGAKLVIVGDIGQSEVLNKLAFLNQLPDKEIKLPTLAGAPPVDKTRIYLVDVPKAAQTEFRVGYVTGLKYDATGDYFKAGLMNYSLGGDFNSRINLNLREDKGWTYGARTSLTGNKYTGEFYFSSGIKANATDSALVEVMKEMSNYAKNGVSDSELKFMKSSIGQRDALRYETLFQKAGFIQRILDYDLPSNYVDQQNKIIASITKEEINRIATKYLDPDKMYILLVGDKAKIQPGLQRLGYDMLELDVNGNQKMSASIKSMK